MNLAFFAVPLCGSFQTESDPGTWPGFRQGAPDLMGVGSMLTLGVLGVPRVIFDSFLSTYATP